MDGYKNASDLAELRAELKALQQRGRQMKKQRLAYMALGAVIAFAGMIAATALNIGAQSSNPQHITAESITVVDKYGKRVLEVGVNKFGGGQLTVNGTQGKPVVLITGSGTSGRVTIMDRSRVDHQDIPQQSIFLSTKPEGSAVGIIMDGEVSTLMSDTKRGTHPGGHFCINNRNGVPVFIAGVNAGGKGIVTADVISELKSK